MLQNSYFLVQCFNFQGLATLLMVFKRFFPGSSIFPVATIFFLRNYITVYSQMILSLKLTVLYIQWPIFIWKVPREGSRTEVLIFPQILLIFSYWTNVLKLDILLPASLLNSPMCFYLQQRTYLLSMPTYLQCLLLNIQLHSSPLYSFRPEYNLLLDPFVSSTHDLDSSLS